MEAEDATFAVAEGDNRKVKDDNRGAKGDEEAVDELFLEPAVCSTMGARKLRG